MFNKFYILNCTKDTSIHNTLVDGNVGLCNNIPLLKNDDGKMSPLTYSRALLDFNFNDALTYFGDAILSNKCTAILKLTQLRYDEFNHASNYDIDAFLLTSSWAEGTGHYDDFSEKTVCNWNQRDIYSNWSLSGGDYNSSISATAHLDFGISDVDMDITTLFKEALTGENYYGILLKFRQEDSDVLSESKRFYSSDTNTLFNPKISIKMDDSYTVYDNSYLFELGKPQHLVYTNFVNEKLALATSVGVSILDSTGIQTQGTNLQSEDGIYVFDCSVTSNDSSLTAQWVVDGCTINDKLELKPLNDYFNTPSITGYFDKAQTSISTVKDIGVATSFNKEMYMGTSNLFIFRPYVKGSRGVDNLGILYKENFIYPEDFYVKFIDAEGVYDFTDWIKLSLFGRTYVLNVDSKCFRYNTRVKMIYKASYRGSTFIVSGSNDIFKIIRS